MTTREKADKRRDEESKARAERDKDLHKELIEEGILKK